MEYKKITTSRTTYLPSQLEHSENIKASPEMLLEIKEGVYFLVNNDVIVYVGKSVNIAKRIISHIEKGDKSFSDMFFIEVNGWERHKLETACIKKYKPRYNIASNRDKSTIVEDKYRRILAKYNL